MRNVFGTARSCRVSLPCECAHAESGCWPIGCVVVHAWIISMGWIPDSMYFNYSIPNWRCARNPHTCTHRAATCHEHVNASGGMNIEQRCSGRSDYIPNKIRGQASNLRTYSAPFSSNKDLPSVRTLSSVHPLMFLKGLPAWESFPAVLNRALIDLLLLLFPWHILLF